MGTGDSDDMLWMPGTAAASIPQPFDECAVAFQQFRPEATRRLAGCVRHTDGRGMEIVSAFGSDSEIIADKPSPLEDHQCPTAISWREKEPVPCPNGVPACAGLGRFRNFGPSTQLMVAARLIPGHDSVSPSTESTKKIDHIFDQRSKQIKISDFTKF